MDGFARVLVLHRRGLRPLRRSRRLLTGHGEPPPSSRERRLRLPRLGETRAQAAWLLGAAFAAQCGTAVLDQGLPTITGFVKADLDVSASVAALLVTAFTIGKITGSYTAGTAADRLGESRVLILGGVAGGVAISLAALGPVAVVFTFVLLAGLASSVATPGGGRLVMVSFPPHRRGLALGIRQAAVPVGGLIGAALLPLVAELTSWRWSLVAAGAASALGAVPLMIVGRRRRMPARTGEPQASRGSPLNRNIVLLTLWGGVFVTGQYALLAFLALDVRQRTGLALATGSLLAALTQAGGLFGRIAWGVLGDRLFGRGRKPLLLLLTGVALCGTLSLAALPEGAPVGVLALVAMLAGVGVVGFQGIWVLLVAESAEPARMGAAMGAATMGVQIIAAASTPLYGLLADLTGTYRTIWFALALALLVSTIPALMLRDTAGRA